MIFAFSVVLIALATFMFFGWGWAFYRLFRMERGTFPQTAAIGLAAVVFIGGLMNLARLAHPPALAAVAGTGVLFAIFALRERFPGERPSAVLAILISAVMIFTIATQLPPRIYNFHDDYQKYFAYPVRMVETGTVFGSPLSAMGLQALGAQAFLDGFVVGFFPIRYINAVDAVFGLFLCLLLATQVTRDRLMSVVCLLSVVFINPQYVNISTLFCGSALIMALFAAEAPASVGLLYAALVAMKPIFAVLIAVHSIAIALLASGGIHAGVRWAVRTGLAAALFLSPWALVHAPHYLATLRVQRSLPAAMPGDIDSDKINLFSLDPLPYGSTAANYTALVIAFAICGLICWRVIPPALKVVAWSVITSATYFVFICILGPMQYGSEHGLRYFVPIAIGAAPAFFGRTALAAGSFRSSVWGLWIPWTVAIVPLAAFGSSLHTRINAALSAHTAASYSWLANDPDYLAYNEYVLDGPGRDDVKSLQDRVPAGEPILAWINTPFYLDYKRNPIIDIDTAGIGAPWATMPPAEYLIWDYDGFATQDQEDFEGTALSAGAGERKDSLLTLDFIRRLRALVAQGEVLFDDGEVKVVHLKASARIPR
jgi:hypothetical protein